MTLTFLGHDDYSNPNGPFPIVVHWIQVSLSPAVFEIFGPKYIEVTTLTSLGHVTSSVTWPFDSQVVISYRFSICTKSVSPTIVEIMGPKYIGVMTLTFLGHVTSSVTWPFESQWAISYWWSIGSKSISSRFPDIWP